jgi:hypothetical protein
MTKLRKGQSWFNGPTLSEGLDVKRKRAKLNLKSDS